MIVARKDLPPNDLKEFVAFALANSDAPWSMRMRRR